MLSTGSRTKKKISIPGKLKQVYTLSGSIRDLQLQQLQMRKLTTRDLKFPSGYLAILQREIDNKKIDFIELVSKRIVTACKDKTDTKLPQYFYKRDMTKFLRQKWNMIWDNIASGNHSDPSIHTFRKNLKDVYYTLKLFHTETANITNDKSPKETNIKFLEMLLADLGNFQDKCVAIGLIKPIWLKNLKQEEKKILTHIRLLWRKDKNKMKKIIVHQLQSIFKEEHC